MAVRIERKLLVLFMIPILVLSILGCIEDGKDTKEIPTDIEINSITGYTLEGAIGAMVLDMVLNGTTDIDVSTIELRVKAPASFTSSAIDLTLGYNSTDPWTGGVTNYSISKPSKSPDLLLPLTMKGGETLTLSLDLTRSGVSIPSSAEPRLTINWGVDGQKELELNIPMLLPDEGIVEIDHDIL